VGGSATNLYCNGIMSTQFFGLPTGEAVCPTFLVKLATFCIHFRRQRGGYGIGIALNLSDNH
jgi:hypothetical protein